MANPTSFPGDIVAGGDLNLSGGLSPTKTRAQVLSVAQLSVFTVPMTRWRVWDAMQTNLPGTPATDDLGLIGGTFTSGAPSLQTDDFGGNAAAVSYYARAEIILPWDYIAANTVTIRLHAGMLTTAADQACTADLEVYKSDEDSTSTGDLYAGAALNINSLVFADKDFSITATTLNPGDLLDVRLHVSADDDGDAGVMKACIGSVQLLCDVR